MVEIHERVSSLETSLDYCGHCGRTLWPVIYLPLLALTFVMLWAVVAGVPTRIRLVVRTGLCLLVAAVFLEAASPVLFHRGWGHGSVVYELEVAVEEGFEYAGWMLITTGLLALALTAWSAVSVAPVRS
jgi:hypothetical protein